MGLRVLLAANAPWMSTGYGIPAASLAPRLKALAEVEEVAIFAYAGLTGGMMEWQGMRVYPHGDDKYGNDLIGLHATDFRADVVITLLDAWVCKGTAENLGAAKWLPWFPVDAEPVPGRVLERLEGAAIELVYSRWGERMMHGAGHTGARYMPIGIEPSVYRVMGEEERHLVEWARREVFRGAEHVAMMVGANKGYPDRKNFQGQMAAWARFALRNPGAVLYIHADPTTRYGGLNLEAMAEQLGVKERVIFPDVYQYFIGYPREALATLYNAADALLAASCSEGFGIPIVEAQASGLPVIVSDFASMPELVRCGAVVGLRGRTWHWLDTWHGQPDEGEITAALEDVRRATEVAVTRELSAAVHEEFGWEGLVERHWRPLLRELGEG